MKYALVIVVMLCAVSYGAPSKESEVPNTVRVRILSSHHPLRMTVRAVGDCIGPQGVEKINGSPVLFTCEGSDVKIKSGRYVAISAFFAIVSKKISVTINGRDGVLTRTYEGILEISAEDGRLVLILELPFERYVHESAVAELGVVLSGLKKTARTELVRAMEIAVRSFLLFEGRRHEGYRFCDLTHCVHFPGIVEGGDFLSAGSIMFDGDKIVCAYFHSTCGGILAGPESYWERSHPFATFRRGYDADGGPVLCSSSPHYRWKRFIRDDVMRQIIGTSPRVIDCVRTGGRVTALVVDGGKEISISRFMSDAGRIIGWNAVKSNSFIVSRESGGWLFTGSGLGHGVGLCQYGAATLAASGKNAEEILSFYYPGSKVLKK